MGSASSKFKKYLQHGDEFAAMQVYQNSADLRENLDPSSSYGESHNHNTPLHYAAKHGMKHLVRTFLSDHGGNPNKRNGDDESSIHCVCRVGQVKSPSTEERRTMCVSIMLMWRGPMMKDGEKERPQLNAQDKLGNTALHYAASSGLRKCVEMLVSQGAGIFIENKNKATSCDMAVKAEHHQIAAYLESHMVFADATDNVNENVGLQTVNSENGSDGDSEVYAGLRAQDLQEAKDQLLVETADMLHIPLFTAEALLRDNEWSKALLLEKWMSNALQCCDTAGIAPPTSALQLCTPTPSAVSGSSNLSSVISPPPLSVLPGHSFLDCDATNKKLLCEICCNNMSASDINSESPSCGHQFCSSCWESYLTMKIQEGGSHHILCPAVNCNILVDVDFIEKLVSPDIARKYIQFDIEAFVERNKTIKWCPLPGCGRAVRYPEAELNLRPFFFSNLNTSSVTSHAVDCGNGHFFCWECLGEAHSPCGCDQWFKWQSKIAEIRPEELKISSGETEDAANFLWLVTNSKPCPNCKSPIQKNEGCNHMKCSKCKYIFCWVCLESWKKHSSATGGYFRCNRYDIQDKMDEKLGVLVSEASVRNKEMQELSRFIHYYTRFKNHQNSVKLEEPLLKSAKGKMAVLSKSLPSQEKQKEELIEKGIRFIEEGIRELLKCRRVLCGSYVFGYYLLDNGYNKSIFEYLQNELEEIVEKLSDMVAREYLVTPRGQIIATTLLARRRRHKLVHAVSGGLLPPDTASGLRKGKRRKISSLIGMVSPSGSDALDVMERVLDLSQPWVKDNSGKHTNLAALLDWPDFDSEDDECNLDQSLTLALLGKCSRTNCPRPRARNPQTGIILDFCSLSCTQSAKFHSSSVAVGTDLCTNAWEGCDSSMELLIALEMSRLQMIEDEARRRQSWLQERSKEHHIEHMLSSLPSNLKEQRWPRNRFRSEYLSDYHNRPSTSSYFGSVDDIHESYKRHQSNSTLHPSMSHSSCAPLASSNHSSEFFTGSHVNRFSSSSLSTAEIAVDYFLKKLSNNEISLRNINFDTEQDHKVEKDLFCFAKKGHENVDGRFKYGDLHENSILSSIFPPSDIRHDLKRSQSLGDLTDRSSEHELQLDSDHAYQDFPEASSKLHLKQPLTNQRDSSLDIESGSGEGDIEWTDQGAPSDIMGELESPITDMEVRGILSQMDVVSQTLNISSNSEPSFQLIVDEGTDKEESNSTEQSSSSQAQNKISNLRIHISHPNPPEHGHSNEFESETGIPNSPTLYISGVSISRSPEPRSPQPISRENTSPSLSLPLIRTPEPRFGNRLETSPLPLYTRSRSSSLIVPSTATTAAHLDPHYIIPRSNDKFMLGESLHLSSLSLQATRASSPFLLTELRVSRSASETEKGRLVFQFPKSPTEGALSSILHVEESNLSSDDFHEALFLGKSQRPSKRKKSKRERNRDKDRPIKLDDNKGKEKPKETLGNNDFIDKCKDIKDKRKAKENLTVA